MFALIEGGVVIYRGSLPKNTKARGDVGSVSGLGVSELTPDRLKELKAQGWLPITDVSVALGPDEVYDDDNIVITSTKVTITQVTRAMTQTEIWDRDEGVLQSEIGEIENSYKNKIRRVIDALPDDAGGNAAGRAWMKTQRDLILPKAAAITAIRNARGG